MSRRHARRRAPGRTRRGIHDDSGQVAGIEAIPFGILVFVVGVLLIGNLWAVIDSKLAVDAAAREGARSYVEGWPSQEQSWTNAQTAALDAAKQQGISIGPADVTPDLNPRYERCARVTITVQHQVTAVNIPFIGGFGHLFPVTSKHSELIDPYRNGGQAEVSTSTGAGGAGCG